MSQPRVLSAVSTNEFLASTASQSRNELVRGKVRGLAVPSPARTRVSGNVSKLLAAYGRKKLAGRAFDENTPYELPNVPNTVRAPDVSFVRTDRLPLGGHGGGWLSLCPDLAVEILSPETSAVELEEKLADYRAAGTSLLWVINPAQRRVCVITATEPARWLADGDVLDGSNVLPGFSCKVTAVFEGVAAD